MVQRPDAGPGTGASPTAASTSTSSPTHVPPFQALASPAGRRHPRSSSLRSPKNRSRTPHTGTDQAASPLQLAPSTSLRPGQNNSEITSSRAPQAQHRDLAPSPSLGPARPARSSNAAASRPLSPMLLDSDPEDHAGGDHDVDHQLVPGRRPPRQLGQARRPSLSSTPEHDDPHPFSPFSCD